jgi:hypothetical protein
MTKSKNLGLNLPSRDNTTDLADINVISENFETIDNEFGNVYNKLNNSGVVNTVSGNPIVLKDSASAPLQNLKLFGKTEQNGTPTPDAPVPLVSVGDSGSFEVGVYSGKNLIEITSTTQTINGITFTINADKSITVNGTATANAQLKFCDMPFLPKGEYIVSGYPTRIDGVEYYFKASNESDWVQRIGEVKRVYTENVSVLGLIAILKGITVNNFTFYPMLRLATETDNTYEPCTKQTLTMPYTLRSAGVQDEIDFAKGVKTEKTYKKVFYGNESFFLDTSNKIGDGYFYHTDTNIKGSLTLSNSLSNRLTEKTGEDLYANAEQGFAIRPGISQQVRLRIDGITTVAELQAKLKEWYDAGNPLTIITERATPVETPLTETELNAYRQLHTNKPNTTILSEADMEVSYVADTKLYIDNKIAELTALTLEG